MRHFAYVRDCLYGFMFYNIFHSVSLYKQCFSFTSVRCGCHVKKQKKKTYNTFLFGKFFAQVNRKKDEKEE